MADTSVQVTQGSGTQLHTFSKSVGGQTVHEEVMLLGEPGLATYVARTGSAVSIATAADHVFQLMAGASLNVYVRRIRLYQSALAATAAIATFGIYRLTSAGTGGTAVGATPLDSTDAAASVTAMSLPTAKGTEGALIHFATAGVIQTVPTAGLPTTLLLDLDFHALRGKSFRVPAGTSNGIVVKNISGIAGATFYGVIDFAEASY